MAYLPSTPDELQQHFSENGVALMASSPPGQSVQKYFFYAQQVHTKFHKYPNLPPPPLKKSKILQIKIPL